MQLNRTSESIKTQSDDEIIRDIWKLIDENGEGAVDKHTLINKLHLISHSHTIPHNTLYITLLANELANKPNSNGEVTFPKFYTFIKTKEKQLLQLFAELDQNNDNRIGFQDLMKSVQKSGMNISPVELKEFMAALDSNNDGFVDYEEWRSFLFLHPHPKATLSNVFSFFQKVNYNFSSEVVTVLDTTSSTSEPKEFYIKLKHLLAGGIAGAVSRTAVLNYY